MKKSQIREKRESQVRKQKIENQNFPPVLQRILNERIENHSDGKSSWHAEWCTDTIQD